MLDLLRFLRFTKEYKLCVNVNDSGARVDVVYGSASRHCISTGDVDVIFAVSVKRVDDHSLSLAPSLGRSASEDKQKQKKVWGANIKARVGGDSNHINYGQFVEALKMCAVRMYTSIIEKETGTVIDCLPASQKEAATRSAFEVMLLKNIIPTAEQQGDRYSLIAAKRLLIIIAMIQLIFVYMNIFGVQALCLGRY